MCAAFGIGPNELLAAPPEITDELERIRDRIAQQRATSQPAGSPLPSTTQGDDEILRAIEQAEFGLTP